jgi:hypothetical protein
MLHVGERCGRDLPPVYELTLPIMLILEVEHRMFGQIIDPVYLVI